ncbi:MAG: hypothetical protein CL441_09235 [Acidimicrobiaceae bacterium]|nr:hypothetical protein [Acidimicrobiaceae bacterium]
MAAMPPDTETAVVDRFMKGLADADYEALALTLAPDVWFRGLLPKRTEESRTAVDLLDTLRGWFDRPGATLEASDQHQLGTRVHVRYRFRMKPRFAPDQWHEVEQTGYCRVKDGRITRLDIVCTGFHPAHDQLS